MLFDANPETTFCSTFKMDKVINLGIPHAGELVFGSIDTPELIKFLEVSQTWRELAGNVLMKRWKGKIPSKMFEACKTGETKIVQLILERCESEEIGLNIQDEHGGTPLMWACHYGHKDVVKLLLDHSERIDLNARSNNGSTAFIVACRQHHKDIVKLLLYFNPDIDISGFEDLCEEMKEFIALHQEASKELERFNAIHQAKRRKLS